MGHVLKIKCVDSRVNVHILALKSVPFTLTTVEVPNLALTHETDYSVPLLTVLPLNYFMVQANNPSLTSGDDPPACYHT
jgi:hypothetical protein